MYRNCFCSLSQKGLTVALFIAMFFTNVSTLIPKRKLYVSRWNIKGLQEQEKLQGGAAPVDRQDDAVFSQDKEVLDILLESDLYLELPLKERQQLFKYIVNAYLYSASGRLVS